MGRKCGPDYEIERAIGGRIAGIDEVGRGPLAGPVVAAAVILDMDRLPRALARQIDDSKRVPAAKREAIAAALRGCAHVGVGEATVEEIDELNILRASHLAMIRALAALAAPPDLALVDGNRLPALPCPARAIVGGDRISLSIAAASIVAKVARDRLMTALAEGFPVYGWDRNMGYPTPQHLAALVCHGVTRHHRRSFAPVRRALSVDESP